MDTSAKTSGPPPLRILAVEDHRDSLNSLRRGLEKLGHSVTAASGMLEALALSPAERFDVLISDILLPDGDGWELLKRLRAAGRAPAGAIAMSIDDSLKAQDKSAEAGYGLHLKKPLSFADLKSALSGIFAASPE